MTDDPAIETTLSQVRDLVSEDGEGPEETDNLIEWGLDSITLMRLAGTWRAAGIEVSFGALAADPTLAAWRAMLAAALPQPADGPGSPADEPKGPGDGPEDPAAGPGSPGDGASADGEPFGLAPLQHAYWVGRQEGQRWGGVAAHLYTEFDGPAFDPERLARAVAAVVRRHPMLRAAVGGDGTQRILPDRGHPAVALADLRGAGPEAAGRELAALRQRRSHQALDIEAGEVFQVGLTLLPGGRGRLHLDVDMVAADARSYRILLADLARAYRRDGDLGGPADYRYARYLDEHRAATAVAAERDARWWSSRLADLPGPPELPLSPLAVNPLAVNPRADPGRIGRRSRWLPPGVRDRLADQANRHGVTLAMAVATAYAEVIGGWSANPRFLLNLPLFDREPLHPDVAGLVGDFTSSVLLDVDLRQPEGFAARAAGLQAQLHSRTGHGAFSGVDLLRELTRRRGEQVTAPVVFTSALGLGELFDPVVLDEFGEPAWIISQGPQVLLDAQVTELHGGVLVNWDVRENLLRPGVADAMFDAFGRLLDRLADGDGWREPVGALLPASQREVRDRVNDTAADYPARCLHDGFFAHAARTPGAPALLWGETGAWTYAEVADRALRAAAALREHRVRPGDVVGVRLPKGPEQVTAVLGVLAAGAAYLPIGWDAPGPRLDAIMAAAGSRVLVTAPEHITGPEPADGNMAATDDRGAAGGRIAADDQTAAGNGAATDDQAAAGKAANRTVLMAEAVLSWPVAAPRPESSSPDGIAYLLFTSGSTGEPKGVRVPHAAAMNTIEDLRRRYALRESDRTLGVSAMEFDLSVFDVFGPLSAGGAVVVVREDERRDTRTWVRLVRERGVTVLNCVPALLDMMLVTGGLGKQLRLVLLGGDWVGADLPRRLAEQVPGCLFAGLGGTTETAIHSTVCEVPGGTVLDGTVLDGTVPADWSAVPYGTPLHNVMCRVTDERGRDRPDWAAGELWIGGAGVADGYHGDAERTAEKFVVREGARWYRTGDLARYWPDGTLEFLGRADHQVKLRGYRIELGEVEAALAAQPGARRAVARLSPRRGGSLQAVVAADAKADDMNGPAGDSENLTPEALRAGVARVLPAYMVPELILVRPELPLTRNGKPDRAAIATLLDRHADAGADAGRKTDASTALERVLLAAWRDALEDQTIGVEDDFLSRGGDSVLATRLVAALREALQTDRIRVGDVFTGRTVAGTAAMMLAEDPGWERIAEIAVEVSLLSEADIDAELRG